METHKRSRRHCSYDRRKSQFSRRLFKKERLFHKLPLIEHTFQLKSERDLSHLQLQWELLVLSLIYLA